MKRILIFAMIICLGMPLLFSCKDNSFPTVTIRIDDVQTAVDQYNYYTVQNEDGQALLDYLASLTYEGEVCSCAPTHLVYIDDEEYAEYGFKLDENDCYVRHDGGQTDSSLAVTPEDLSYYLDPIITPENYQPIEEAETPISLGRKEDGMYQKYTFCNDASKELWLTLRALEYTEADRFYDAPIKLGNADRRFYEYALSLGEEPYVIYQGNQIAKPDTATADKLMTLIRDNCTDSNGAPDGDIELPAYISHRSDKKQYLCQSTDTQTLLSLLKSYVFESVSAFETQPTYKDWSLKVHYVKDDGCHRFYLTDKDGVLYVHTSEHTVAVAPAEDRDVILQIISTACTPTAHITENLSDVDF